MSRVQHIVSVLIEAEEDFDAREYLLNPPRFQPEHYGFTIRNGFWTMWQQHPQGTSILLKMKRTGTYYEVFVDVSGKTTLHTALKAGWLEYHASQLVDAFKSAVASTSDSYDAASAFLDAIQRFQTESQDDIAEANQYNPKGLHRTSIVEADTSEVPQEEEVWDARQYFLDTARYGINLAVRDHGWKHVSDTAEEIIAKSFELPLEGRVIEIRIRNNIFMPDTLKVYTKQGNDKYQLPCTIDQGDLAALAAKLERLFSDENAEGAASNLQALLKSYEIAPGQKVRMVKESETAQGRAYVDWLLDPIVESGPRMKALKRGRRKLSPEERKQVIKAGAVWHHGPNGEESPAVWKSIVDGKTWYVCNTHRAMQAKPNLSAAIGTFKFIKTTA